MKYPPPITHKRLEARRQENRGASHQPGVLTTVGSLLIICDLALVGAKVQAQWQIGCLIPHSKPSVRDARQADA